MFMPAKAESGRMELTGMSKLRCEEPLTVNLKDPSDPSAGFRAMRASTWIPVLSDGSEVKLSMSLRNLTLQFLGRKLDIFL